MKKHLTLTEACAIAHVSRWTMCRWVARGLVHAVKDGNDKSSPIRIDAASLLSMMVTI
jgi:predicted site-specific integrase-resolvase